MPSSRNFVVGLFLVVGILVFAVGLFMIGDRRKLFSKDFEVIAEFKELGGLQNGANVKVGGMDAGEVIDIEVPPQPSRSFASKCEFWKNCIPWFAPIQLLPFRQRES